MHAGALVGANFEFDSLVLQRADIETDFAAQALKGDAGFLIDQDRKAHARSVDVGQLMIKGCCRAGLDAGNVLAHGTRAGAGIEIGRAIGDTIAKGGQFQIS